MKNSLKVIIAALMILAISAGCGDSAPKDDTKGPITLTIWESYNNEEHKIFTSMLEPFREEYQKKTGRELVLRVSRVAHDGMLPKLKVSCQTHTTPDICRVDCAHVVPLAFGKAIYELDRLSNFGTDIDTFAADYVTAAIESNIIEVKGSGNKWERHLFGIPDQTNCVTLFWNKAMFRKKADRLRAAGLNPEASPRTWDEFIEYGKILSEPDGSSYAYALYNTLWWSFPFFNTFGTEFVKRDSNGILKCILNSEEGIQALEFRNNLYRKTYSVNGSDVRVEGGAWQAGSVNPDQGFINGIYSMVLSGPWNLEVYRRAGVDFGVGLIPEGPAGTSSNVGGTNMVVFRSCRHPEAALDLLRFMATPGFQKEWCEKLGQIPVTKAAYDAVDLSSNPELAVFFKQMLSTKARPRLPRFDLLEEIINPEMELAIKGGKTAKQALDDAVRKIDREVLSLVNE